VPAPDRPVERAPADAVARLEHDDLAVSGHQRAGGGEAGEAGADHAHVGLAGAPAHGGGRRRAQREQRRAGGARSDELAAGESVVHGARA
jgi:hypothetical protein